MVEERFYFSRKVLAFIVIVAFSIGSAPFLFDHDRGYLFGSIMNIGGSPLIGYLLFGASLMVGLYHFPNLLRALAKKPAITVTEEFIRLHQFPARTIPVSEVKSVSSELGSVQLMLEGDRKKWINLKIVNSTHDCVEAIEKAVRREAR